MRIAYENKNLRPATLAMVAQANQICAEYLGMGYDLTLRQLYYQFVARGLIANRQTEYKRLGSVINDARMCGLLDWDYIVDRTRNPVGRSHWRHPRDIIEATAKQFHIDYWSDQNMHVEVWVEKEALAGVVEDTTWSYDVTSLACRGYMSQSEQWRAAQRFADKIREGKQVRVIHLGDHDPSGIDMSRDNGDRLVTFLTHDFLRESGLPRGRLNGGELHEWIVDQCGVDDGRLFDLDRIALNMDQIEEYQPPPNPAKMTDSRVEGYLDRFGDESWELDALPPDVLAGLIRDAIEDHMDPDAFAEAKGREEQYRERIHALLANHGDVLELDWERE